MDENETKEADNGEGCRFVDWEDALNLYESHILSGRGAVLPIERLLGNSDWRLRKYLVKLLWYMLIFESKSRLLLARHAVVCRVLADLLRGPNPMGREISEDVFCILSVEEDIAIDI
ncbi:hypothetical protein QQ045_024570 [Rhodiola kirilowii]